MHSVSHFLHRYYSLLFLSLYKDVVLVYSLFLLCFTYAISILCTHSHRVIHTQSFSYYSLSYMHSVIAFFKASFINIDILSTRSLSDTKLLYPPIFQASLCSTTTPCNKTLPITIAHLPFHCLIWFSSLLAFVSIRPTTWCWVFVSLPQTKRCR